MTAYFRGLPLGAISVESAMAREVRTCSAEDSVKDIEDLMVEDRIRRVPVVDSEYRVVGIISLNDLALAAQHEKRLSPKKPLEKLHVAETLAALCEHRVPAASP
ncbi:CBS domain-containing protein [Candidatus Sumerlaeota bacterium]|nr:CBS domain-containing protein [Candidatus Sumerlaeota bacterium]